MTWSKDAWILRALRYRVYVAREDGSVWYRAPAPKSAIRTVLMEGKKWVYRRVKPSLHRKTERLYFTMTFDGISKSVLVNRVIGLALIPNPDNLPEVNHKSGDKTDNSVGNLEWASRSDQEKHAFAHGLKATRGTANGNSKLTPDDVIAIRQSDATVTDLAMKHGVSRGTISDIREERTWRHV